MLDYVVAVYDNPNDLETWKMNLLAVSEKHRVLVIAVGGKLNVY